MMLRYRLKLAGQGVSEQLNTNTYAGISELPKYLRRRLVQRWYGKSEHVGQVDFPRNSGMMLLRVVDHDKTTAPEP